MTNLVNHIISSSSLSDSEKLYLIELVLKEEKKESSAKERKEEIPNFYDMKPL